MRVKREAASTIVPLVAAGVIGGDITIDLMFEAVSVVLLLLLLMARPMLPSYYCPRLEVMTVTLLGYPESSPLRSGLVVFLEYEVLCSLSNSKPSTPRTCRSTYVTPYILASHTVVTSTDARRVNVDPFVASALLAMLPFFYTTPATTPCYCVRMLPTSPSP